MFWMGIGKSFDKAGSIGQKTGFGTTGRAKVRYGDNAAGCPSPFSANPVTAAMLHSVWAVDTIKLMGRIAIISSFWVLGLYWSLLASWAACRDVASIDFRNRVIPAASDLGKADYGTFNGPGPGGPLRLRDGLFLQWDRITSRIWSEMPAEEREEIKQKPDWKTTIEQDTLIRPTGSGGIRVLVLSQVHLTGTGAFTYVFGFRCSSGSLQKIFEASGEGVKFERATDNGIEVTVAVWSQDDAHCCPSREERLRYIWSPARKRVVREPSNAAIPWLP